MSAPGGGPDAAAGPGMRVEHDSMGDVLVPAEARWGAQTQRAVENFPISGRRVESSLVAALALVKGQAALVNAEIGVIDPGVGGG
ncbi:MAG: aspartate ammonia-lyase, partial [Acidimicrobiales bacterium]